MAGSLADDIARIAKLRGRDPTAMTQAEQERRRVSIEVVRAVFFAHGLPDLEMRCFDRLPLASRRMLVALPLCASALYYKQLLEDLGERMAITAVQEQAAFLAGDRDGRDTGPRGTG